MMAHDRNDRGDRQRHGECGELSVPAGRLHCPDRRDARHPSHTVAAPPTGGVSCIEAIRAEKMTSEANRRPINAETSTRAVNASLPTQSESLHVRLKVAGAFAAVLLASHHPIADAQQADAANAPALVVFSQSDGRADQPSLSAEATAILESIHDDPSASGIRIGHSDPVPVLAARSLSLALPSASQACTDSEQSEAVVTGVEVEYHDEGLASLYAQDDAADTKVALVIQDQDVLGSIRCGDQTYKLQPLGDGMTAVYEFDATQLRAHPEGWEEFILESWREFVANLGQEDREPPPDANPGDAPGTPSTASDSGDVIDVLVAYTPRARTLSGNIDALIQSAINNATRSYRNSNIGFRLRVVHKHEVNYTEDAELRTDLHRLRYTSSTVLSDRSRPDPNGYMDEIHGLRDRYGADLVALIVGNSTGGSCGIANLPPFGGYPSHNFQNWAFSVTAQTAWRTTRLPTSSATIRARTTTRNTQ